MQHARHARVRELPAQAEKAFQSTAVLSTLCSVVRGRGE